MSRNKIIPAAIMVISFIFLSFSFTNCGDSSGVDSDGLVSATASTTSQFEIGMNVAWTKSPSGVSGFAKDFGGKADKITGISGRSWEVDQMFKELADNNVTFIRWWVWPDLTGDSLVVENDTITGLGGTTIQDMQLAIDLADKYGVKIMFCFYSFDTFNISETGIHSGRQTISNMLRDQHKLTQLIDNSIGTFVQETYDYIDQKKYSKNLIHSWDIINEPEWAIHRSDFSEGKKYTANKEFEPCVNDSRYVDSSGNRYHFCLDVPQDEIPTKYNSEKIVDAVSIDQMESFIIKSSQKIKNIEPSAKITVGFAADKWSDLWSQQLINHLDIIQNHFYQWTQDYVHGYDVSVSEIYNKSKYGNKPVIMAEYPFALLSERTNSPNTNNVITHRVMLETWMSVGYAGVMGWHYYNPNDTLNENDMPSEYKQYTIERALNDLKEFSEDKGLKGPVGSQ